MNLPTLKKAGAAMAAALLLFSITVVNAAERVYPAPGDSPSLGSPDAPVRIIEFVDYQ